MARESASPQSAAPPHLGPNAPPGGTVASCTARRPSLAAAALCPYSSEIGAVCAKERSYGSVRGVLGNRHPYRDRRCGGISKGGGKGGKPLLGFPRFPRPVISTANFCCSPPFSPTDCVFRPSAGIDRIPCRSRECGRDR